MTDTSGPQSRMPFAFYDPEECCWRTSQATFLSDSDRYSETWPRSGMTRRGFAYELPMPALHMAAPASSSSLLPTPEAKLSDSGPDYARASREGSGGDDLTTTLHRLFPTPRATAGTKGGPNQRGSSGDLMLPSAVMDLLPTPSVADALGGHLTRGGARSSELLLPGVAKSLTASRGDLTAPPSAAGSTSPDDPHPDLLSEEGEAESA